MNYCKFGLKMFIAAAAVAVGLIGASEVANASDRNRVIADGVYFGDIPAGGLTEVEANEVIEQHIDSIKDVAFEMDAQGESVRATAGDFGVEWVNKGIVKDAINIGVTGSIIERYKTKMDLKNEKVVYDLQYKFDESKIDSFLEANTSYMNVPPVDASLAMVDGKFVVTDGVTGIDVDCVASATSIASTLNKGWDEESMAFDLECTVATPNITSEQLNRVHDLIGTFTTDYSTSSSGRAANVRNGASKINGKILFPGEQLSVSETVHPFTAENGYELAGSYENGTTVQTYGGGICQVSTTLYNAVIRAELQIDTRYSHSMIVSYVKPSMDAAIADGIKDFKFTNNYDFPIYIEGYTSGGYITFNIFGEETRPANRTVEFESETTSTTEPETEFKLTSDLALGSCETEQSAHVGYTARLWKIIKVDGEVQSREQFNSSTYNPSPRKILVGTAGADATSLSALNTAIATKNEDTVRSAASSAKADQDKREQEKNKVDESDDDDDVDDDYDEDDGVVWEDDEE